MTKAMRADGKEGLYLNGPSGQVFSEMAREIGADSSLYQFVDAGYIKIHPGFSRLTAQSGLAVALKSIKPIVAQYCSE